MWASNILREDRKHQPHGILGEPCKKDPSLLPLTSTLLSFEPILFHLADQSLLATCWGKYCLGVYRSLTCMVCFLALMVLWDEQSGCYVSKRKRSANTGMFKSHAVMAEKARAPAPSSILHKTTVRVFCRGRILIKDE